MKKLFASIIAALILTGCYATIPPTKEQLASANYGTVTFAQSEVLIRGFLENFLIDPQSAQLGITRAQLDHWAQDYSGKHYFGKLVGFEVNAKNSYGGYTGKKRYYAFIVNGQIIQVYHVLTDGISTSPALRVVE